MFWMAFDVEFTRRHQRVMFVTVPRNVVEKAIISIGKKEIQDMIDESETD